MAYDDLLKDPKTAYLGLEEKHYKAELELVDRYKSFVAEVLRLSVLGIAVFGFLYNEIFKHSSDNSKEILLAASLGLGMFAISAVSALLFQYFSSEGFRYYIVGLRHYFKSSKDTPTPDDIEKAELFLKKVRKKKIKYCIWTKGIASLALGVGAFLMAFSLILSFK